MFPVIGNKYNKKWKQVSIFKFFSKFVKIPYICYRMQPERDWILEKGLEGMEILDLLTLLTDKL